MTPEKQIRLEGHVICPKCKNQTLPKIRDDSSALGSCCRHCGQYVHRDPIILDEKK